METIYGIVEEIVTEWITPLFNVVFGCFLLLCFCLRVYCKLTMGHCNVEGDMKGKTVLVTGATSGIGKATAFELAKRNARVILACRNIYKADKVADEIKMATGNQDIIIQCRDLSSFKSVRACAESIIDTEEKLHVLINNAGISGVPHEQTSDGHDLIMQSNHFGHFLLTMLLLDLLKRSAPSKVINVSSVLHHISNFDINGLKNERRINPFRVYANSKLANILFTKELTNRLIGTGVTVNSLHPGCVRTNTLKNIHGLFPVMTRLFFLIVGKTPEEGAQTTLQLAIDPSLEQTTGKHFSDCRETFVSKSAKDRLLARKLFKLSEKIVWKYL